MEDWDTKAQALPENADKTEIEFTRNAFRAASAERKRWQETVDRLSEIDEARKGADERAQTGEQKPAAASLEVNEPKTYTERSSMEGKSFFVDLVNATRGDMEARSRLERHTAEPSRKPTSWKHS
jgi:hypothetical protein